MPALKPAFPVLRRSHPLARDLVLCWPLCEGRGDKIHDPVGHGFYGFVEELSGIPPTYSWDQTPWGYGVKFIQAANSIEAGGYFGSDKYLDNLASISIQVGFMVTSTATSQNLAGKFRAATNERAWRLIVASTNITMRICPNGTTDEDLSTTGGPITAGAWFDVIVTYSAGPWECYINGKAQPKTAAAFTSTAIAAAAFEFHAGYSGFGSQQFIGTYAYLNIWRNRALTAQEAAEAADDPFAWVRPRRRSFVGFVPAGAPPPTDWAEIARTASSNYRDAGLTNGITYQYRVKAIDISGNISAASSTAQATPTPGIPGSPPLPRPPKWRRRARSYRKGRDQGPLFF